jgi:cytochrome c556
MQPESAAQTRQALFRLLSLVSEPLRSMREGHSPVDLQVARISAYRLNGLSAMIPEVFEKDTRAFDVKTTALDAIWTQPGDFVSRVDALTLAASELDRAIAAKDQTAILEAIDRVETACTTCHNSYRKN